MIEKIKALIGSDSPALLGQIRAVRWLQTGGAGVEGLIPHVQSERLTLTNARGVGAAPITEHMFGMLLMVTRRLAQAWDRQKTGQWNGEGLGDRVGLLSGKTPPVWSQRRRVALAIWSPESQP